MPKQVFEFVATLRTIKDTDNYANERPSVIARAQKLLGSEFTLEATANTVKITPVGEII